MTKSLPVPVAYPAERPHGCPFDPPAELARLRAAQPITQLAYPDGHVGWLVTSRELVRAVLADARFSVRPQHKHLPFPGSQAPDPDRPTPPGVFTAADPPEHTRYRHLLTGQFTVRRMRLLTERLREITAAHLDEMQRNGPPADLVSAFAQPVPTQMICELLGVPFADRDLFLEHGLPLMNLNTPAEERARHLQLLLEYMHRLVVAKRAQPTDDLLSGLTASDLTDDELTFIGFTLLGAGTDTTANMLALGTFALLGHPEQLAELRAHPELTNQAVEELLRYLSIIPATVRVATDDVELGGALIKAGQSVTVSIPAANRDPAHFADPDTLDLHRETSGQVGFGHGIHQCLGQQLARVEMQVGFPALFERFPTLRLAVQPDEVPMRDDMMIYGVQSLPVTWE